MSTGGNFGYGQLGPADTSSKFNALAFVIGQMLARVRTMAVVKVVGVTTDGELAEVGFVDAVPLVNQIDGNGNATPHGTVYNLPYFRLQGGSNAVIIDPQVDDIGFAVIADRDISAVKTTKAAANPGTGRRFDFADGVYIGGILNGVPTQYVQMNADGVKIADKNGNSIAMTAAGIVVTGTLIVDDVQIAGTIKGAAGATYAGNITTTGNVTGAQVTAGTISLTTHRHTGVTTGGGTSGGPTP